MITDLLQITFLNQYIISPKTFLHKINHDFKIFIIFMYLCLVPYINHVYIIISFIIYILIIIYARIPKKKLASLLHISFLILIFLFNIWLYNINTEIKINYNTQNYIVIKKLVSETQVYKQKYNIIDLHEYYTVFILPEFIIRTSLIYLLYLISIQILYLTTKYENVIIHYLIKCQYKSNKRIRQEITIITLASSFLIIIHHHISYISKATKLRNTKQILKTPLYYHALQELLQTIIYDIIKISSILYFREIKCKNLTLKNIYYL